MSYEEVIEKCLNTALIPCQAAGLNFDEEIRAKICKGKVSSENWLKIHKIGIKKLDKVTPLCFMGI